MDPAEVAGPAADEAADLGKRPTVTVVMPFAGEPAQAAEAVEMLRSLERGSGDELILVDNSGDAGGLAGVTVMTATGERSPAHARNAGAAAAGCEWILFIDSDCRPRPDLLERYFADSIGKDVGALAGEVVGVTEPVRAASASSGGRSQGAAGDGGAGDLGGPSLAARYGAARSFLSQSRHLAHPYLPRAVAANLLVRRTAFEQVGGFYEGLRAAEDTDFAWRLQQAGWRLELRPEAWVEHRYRTTLTELRRQWRGYAAGRAWLARRYEGFVPDHALTRALGRIRRESGRSRVGRAGVPSPQPSQPGVDRFERGKYLAIDALLALEELAGFLLSNRPPAEEGDRPAGAEGDRPGGEEAEAAPACHAAETAPGGGAHVVFVADRFPSPGDPLVELPGTLGARVEAAARPRLIPPDAHGLRIHYREDDGVAERLAAFLRLCATHPILCVRDKHHRAAGEVSLMTLAPAIVRLQRDNQARVAPLGGGDAPAVARRLQALAGRRAG